MNNCIGITYFKSACTKSIYAKNLSCIRSIFFKNTCFENTYVLDINTKDINAKSTFIEDAWIKNACFMESAYVNNVDINILCGSFYKPIKSFVEGSKLLVELLSKIPASFCLYLQIIFNKVLYCYFIY